ncbi:MAG: hypothetical protein A2365_02960 [Candidatus Nealsonbacteria bacterium RIFOXYB1_FULL_40_15]|uniref:DUF1648 domain-containing protein n=1 Tax=Candidatus Nealsonbacteria bacterium RIFOXYB1_FULL_40_15 TaxID=1801677 RepID=A0A1G2ENR2_9BACT|nr:MAG: hypothetical protein A2365_02960 [Candidatus Nealsonbacteria bacterium RIFOXYB1_FULL_40_15]OGZ29869.1 MAG: hypothetical protein A2562_01995 [Candidatus Nealsonbacteria bacterium RIFOXYD1_FULL_39_11]
MKKELVLIFLIIISFAAAFFLYPVLPDRIPIHWNASGQPDDFGSKEFGTFFLPVLSLAVYLLMFLLPKIDPLKKNYESFENAYFWIRSSMIVFFLLLHGFVLSYGIGYRFNINYLIIPLISLLFAVIGIFLPRIKKNWFVGIRTPWTIQSDRSWEETHNFSGKLFIAAGIISFFGIFTPFPYILLVASAISASVASVVYSYFSFRKNG